jgi:hypothetical protein
MRPSPQLLFSLVLAGGALLIGESAVMAQGYYGPAYGPPPAPAPSYRPAPRYAAPAYYEPASSHNGGLFVRLTAGLGYLYATESAGGPTYTYSGLGGTASLAIGGVIAPNLVLYGEITGTSAADAQVDYGDGGYNYPGVDVTLFGFGPGVAYYIEPANVYLSATLVFSKLTFSSHDDYGNGYAEDTDMGIGGSFMVGKEWWVARHLGMGVAGQLHVASMRDSYNQTRLTATALSVLFSLTFN